MLYSLRERENRTYILPIFSFLQEPSKEGFFYVYCCNQLLLVSYHVQVDMSLLASPTFLASGPIPSVAFFLSPNWFSIASTKYADFRRNSVFGNPISMYSGFSLSARGGVHGFGIGNVSFREESQAVTTFFCYFLRKWVWHVFPQKS